MSEREVDLTHFTDHDLSNKNQHLVQFEHEIRRDTYMFTYIYTQFANTCMSNI